jgi:hypothetical protein
VIPVHHNPTENMRCSGKFADVWKGQYQDREVAVKVLRVHSDSNLKHMGEVGRPQLITCISELTISCAEVLRGGCGMEDPPPSKCSAATGCDEDRDPIRDGIGVDDEW